MSVQCRPSLILLRLGTRNECNQAAYNLGAIRFRRRGGNRSLFVAALSAATPRVYHTAMHCIETYRSALIDN